VKYTAGQPYVGATLRMFPGPGGHMGAFIAWDAATGKIVWSNKERFSAWSGALVTATDVAFYGTLEGYMKAVDARTGKELWKFKTPSGIIGNPMTTWGRMASSTSPSCQVSEAGRASDSRPASKETVKGSARSVRTRNSRSTPRSVAC